jgi:hypothetical protein
MTIASPLRTNPKVASDLKEIQKFGPWPAAFRLLTRSN